MKGRPLQWDNFSRPAVVVVPAGAFTMGSPENEPRRLDVEGPQHTVFIAAPFAVAKFPVTVEEFAAFTASSGYCPGTSCQIWDGEAWHESRGSFANPGFAQTGDHPAVCVSWED